MQLTSKNGKEFTQDKFTPIVSGFTNISQTTTSGTGVGNTVTFTAQYSTPVLLQSVAGQFEGMPSGDGTLASPKIWAIDVINAKSTLSLDDIVTATGATKNLYSDSGFTTEVIGENTITLDVGDTTVYIKVTDAGLTAHYYAVTITRESVNPEVDFAITYVDFPSTVTVWTNCNTLTGTPAASNFSIGGADANGRYVTSVRVSSNVFELELSSPLYQGDVITLSYTQGDNLITDGAGHSLQSFSDLAVINQSANAKTTINISGISGVIAPEAGATPVASIVETDQYTGTVSWSPGHSTFAYATQYTATITLTPKAGYTLTGVPANFFTVAGATVVSNQANSGVITAEFPQTVYNP